MGRIVDWMLYTPHPPTHWLVGFVGTQLIWISDENDPSRLISLLPE